MARRSTPQNKLDDIAFPVRLRLLVPERGFVSVKPDPHQWLDQHIGRTEYAWHGGPRRPVRDATTLHFCHPRDAVAFLDAYPNLELADGTTSPAYSSPFRSVASEWK